MSKPVNGPYVRHGAMILGPAPQISKVDHRYRGFTVQERPGLYLIAESCVHAPTADLLAASWDMFQALEQILWQAYFEGRVSQNALNDARAAVDKAKGKAQ